MTPTNELATTITILTPSSMTATTAGDNSNGAMVLAFNEQLKATLSGLQLAPPLTPFADVTFKFLAALAKALLASKVSELVALGFWLRPKRLKDLQAEFTAKNNAELLELDTSDDIKQWSITHPLGCVFHVTPANVDTMFVYSWVCSLLIGNCNVVRVSRQESAIKLQLLNILETLFQQPEFTQVAKRNVFVQYEHQQEITAYFSQFADARILWGGDYGIQQIRQIVAKPTTRDISFADRYSVALLNLAHLSANAQHRAQQISELAARLWRDTEPFTQMACSSPKSLLWLGEGAEQHSYLDELLQAVNSLAVTQTEAMELKTQHLVTAQLTQASGFAPKVRLSDAIIAIDLHSNVTLDETNPVLDWHTGRGCFYVQHIDSIQDVARVVNRRCQTLSVWGVANKDLVKLVNNAPIKGIDRVVPVGQALDFQPVWDGYDLLAQLSRIVTVRLS